MLDIRLLTFKELCRCKSYTKTAENLFITQPNVSQHIRYLEKFYGHILVEKGKFKLTVYGDKLLQSVNSLCASSSCIKKELDEIGDVKVYNFGATLTVADYYMPSVLEKLDYGKINMRVANTRQLLQYLDDGIIEWAIIEGQFDRQKYISKPVSTEKFVAVCGAQNVLINKKQEITNLLDEHLFIRESGSGTRDILERYLNSQNLTINSFKQVSVIASLNAIKSMVERYGISFMYYRAIEREIKSGNLVLLEIDGFDMKNEFNFVYLPKHIAEKNFIDIYNKICPIKCL